MTQPTLAASLALIHVTLLVVLILAGRQGIPRRFAAARATIGTVGMACLLLLSALAFLPLPGLWTRMGENTVAGRQAAAIEAKADDPLVSDALNRAAEPPPGATFSLAWLRQLGAGLEQAATGSVDAPRSWWSWLLVALLAGSAISLVRLAVALRAIAILRRASTPIVDDAPLRAIADLRQRCGCRRAIELRESADVNTASTCGGRRPAILLPRDWRDWSAEELSAALAHEVAHVHRHDYWQRLVALTSVALHFYHPLVRAAAWRLAADQEFATDRLASGLSTDEAAYTRGLARLALRYHDSLLDKSAWSSVSIMPRSSDFLARRLEMLRVKTRSPNRHAAKLLAGGVSVLLVVCALATALLRGAAAEEATAAEAGADKSRPVAETARLAPRPAAPINPDRAAGRLYDSPDFAPDMIRHGKRGAYVIRVKKLLDTPALAPFAGELNRRLSAAVCELLQMPPETFNIRDVAWIAGNLFAQTKPLEGHGEKSMFLLGYDSAVIRLNRVADWQQLILKHAAGATLETFEGQSFVQLPPWPSTGGACPQFRFPNDQTIVISYTLAKDPETVAGTNKRFFDDAPGAYEWADTWRAVDTGLFTLLFDNRKLTWHDVVGMQSDAEKMRDLWPAVDKTTFFAATIGWAEEKATLAVRSACADHADAEEVEHATRAYLSYFKEDGATDDDVSPDTRELIRQYLLSAKTEISGADGPQQFVQTAGSAPFTAAALIGLIPWVEPFETGIPTEKK